MTVVQFSTFLYKALLLTFLVGCGGYAQQTQRMRSELESGNPSGALSALSDELKVADPSDDPDASVKNATLLLLERGTILQALGRYKEASRDFQTADEQLEVLDLTKDNMGNIAKFLYSDDATVYKAPPYEKLMVNTLNLLNYLSMGQLNGAKIEARRFEINRSYFQERDSLDTSISVFGSYMAGVAFESAGEPTKAIRFYADAYEAGGLPGLKDVILRLHKKSGADDPRIRSLLEEEYTLAPENGEILLIIQDGLVPRKIAKRMPIGAALTYSASHPENQRFMTPKERARANRFAAKGLVTWVNYPALQVDSRVAPSILVSANAQTYRPSTILNVDLAAKSYFEKQQGLFIAAAISRAVTRAIAGKATEELSGGSGGVGFLLGLLVQGSMVAADTPDTRAWNSLPARIRLLRLSLPAGTYPVSITLGRRTFSQDISVSAGNISVINFSKVRR